MAGRTELAVNVFDAALGRLIEQYEQGHRIVVSLSGGKDSTVCLEMAVLAATATGRLPVEAVTRDEEIAYPGTYEYLDRVHQRDDVRLTWLVANMPIINAFNREEPYWWVFDPLLPPEQWVRQPPSYSTHIDELTIMQMTTKKRYPVVGDQRLISVIGLRVSESRGRLMGLFSSGGYMTGAIPQTGVYGCRPIYDWGDGDIWLAINKFGWDYNEAYNVMHRLGIPKRSLRIGPPTMNAGGARQLQTVASVAWPQWWDRVVRRIPGIKTYAQYGLRAVTAERRLGERWAETFQRECIERAPQWIADRSTAVRDKMLATHQRHASGPLPDVEPVCYSCYGALGSWKALTNACYLGDPFSIKLSHMPYVEPEFFRPGAGTWGGRPSF